MADEDDKKEEGLDAEAAEGSEELTEEELEAKKAKKRKTMMLMIGLALVVVLAGAGAATYFLLFAGGGDEEMAAETEQVKAEQKAHFFDVPELVVNLDTGSGNLTRYLKIKLSLETGNLEDATTLQEMLPRVQDDFQTYLRSLRVEDLQGSSGIYKLKEALLLRVNQAVEPVEVKNVLVREVLIQ